MTRTDIINHYVRGGKSFLEIGYYDGKNHGNILTDKKIAVDPYPFLVRAGHKVHKITSDEFFKMAITSGLKYDVIFIDGLHESQQVDRDIANALLCINEGGVILVHDCLPTKIEHTIVPRPKPTGHWNGDVYKSWLKLRDNPNVSMFVIDADNGVGVIQKGKQKPKTIEPIFKNITPKNMNILSLHDWQNSILPLDV